jgi:hypothetical protein
MKNLPIGIQDFEKLRESDYLYIDKTESYIKSILSGKYFLLTRPRRFGKSLMIQFCICRQIGQSKTSLPDKPDKMISVL